MDLSAVIFVVLALAWAVYLIPKALQHHDEMASDRLVQGHSERVRILRRRSTPTETVEVEVEEVVAGPTQVATESHEPQQPARAPRGARLTSRRRSRRQRPPLTVAGRAARRRRRVLAVLLLAVVVCATLGYLAYVPRWLAAVPAVLVVAFLVVARLSVRSAQRSSLAQRRPVRRVVEQAPAAATADEAAEAEEQVDVELHGPTEPEAEVLADDGSLWDPLPLTLPTYVNKARARRTVRTIELTGMQSSGHDQDDSALAREAQQEPAARTAEGEQRRVAGA